jgi:hypothetical protein
MKSVFVILIGLVGLASVSQAGTSLRCESEDLLITFNMTDNHAIDTYTFSWTSAPETKTAIAIPAYQGQGVFDVSDTVAKTENYLELPPYAAREDVTQFMVTFTLDTMDGDPQPRHGSEDILCLKNTGR